MKICLVNKFHYIKGGSETYYFGLADLLKKHGHEVIFFSMKDEKNFPCEQEKYFVENVDFNAKMNPFQLAKTSLKMLYSFEAKKKFKQLIEDEHPDIIHLNIFQSQLTGSIVDVAKDYNIPIVYTAHDLKTVCPTYLMMNHGVICDKCIHGNYFNCIRSSCMKDSKAKSTLAAIEAETYRILHTYKKIDAIIAPSQHHKRRIMEGKVTNCPIYHVPNFLPSNTEYQSVNNQGDYLLYFGRLSVEKGVQTLLKAYAKSNIQKPLYVVGTGPEENNLIQLAKKLMVNERIKFLGFKKGQELKDVVANSAFVVLPSECCENAPYSIMEAQAIGRPVIVSENGGLPELVEEGVTGFVAKSKNVDDLADKLIKAINKDDWDHEKIVEFAKNKYSAENYLKQIEECYNRLLKNGAV